jgi:hypothetical protein
VTTASGSNDLFSLHQWIKAERVDLLIGNPYGKDIARAEGNSPSCGSASPASTGSRTAASPASAIAGPGVSSPA